MLARLSMYRNVVAGAVVIALLVGLYFYIHGLKKKIEELQSTLKDSYIEVANSKLEATRYKAALESQSSRIEALEVNKDKAERELAKWKEKPAKIRYNTIYKIREVKSSSCKDIKSTINSIRKINYKDL